MWKWVLCLVVHLVLGLFLSVCCAGSAVASAWTVASLAGRFTLTALGAILTLVWGIGVYELFIKDA